jgi:AAA family ATP:ADP antiporter
MSEFPESPGDSRFLTSVLGIRRDEFAAVAWSFAYFFCILSAYYMLRPVRDAMAIDSGVSTIPWLFTGTFVVMVIVAPIFGWIASRFPRKQFLPWVYYFFIANILMFFAAFTVAQDQLVDQVWISRAFFVWLSVFNLFIVTVFWSFMADIYSTEQSRRLFGVISAGGSTGAILGPIVTGALVVPVGFQNLLPVSALLLLGGVYCIYKLRGWVRQHDEGDDSDSVESGKAIGGRALEGMRLVFAKPYFGMIAVALMLANFVGVFAYTYMAELVGLTFDNTDRQTQVFAWIDAAINVFSFIGQIILVKHSVRRLGVGVTLALLPIVSAIGFALLAINPVFAIMAALQILRRSLTFGFSKPTNDMLYSVVSAEEKYKVKNFIETAIYRSGDVVAAWTVRLLSGIGITGLAIICIPVAITWAVLSFRIGRKYGQLDDAMKSAEPSESS